MNTTRHRLLSEPLILLPRQSILPLPPLPLQLGLILRLQLRINLSPTRGFIPMFQSRRPWVFGLSIVRPFMILFLSGCEPVCDGALVLYHVLELYGGMGPGRPGDRGGQTGIVGFVGVWHTFFVGGVVVVGSFAGALVVCAVCLAVADGGEGGHIDCVCVCVMDWSTGDWDGFEVIFLGTPLSSP
jgi:hypothetical protein